jgi:hypothetical protein
MRKLTKMKKTILVETLALAIMFSGCKTGMFAPRTGELFQTTRMCPGPGASVYTAPLMVWVWGVQKRGGEWTIPIGIVGIPIAAAGFVVDECVVSPLVDLVCLPYDLCQPYHGCYLRIVDEDGRPVQGAKIHGHFDLVGKAFSGTTDAVGEFKINRLHDVKGYFLASCDNHASWYQSRNFDVANAKAESDGKIVFQYTLSKMNPGGWKAKKDISREELQKLVPGKWSADKESRRWLMDGFNCSFANDPGRYCLTLDESGSAVAYVPFGYRFDSGGKDKSNLRSRYSSWSIQRNGNVTGGKDDPYRNEPPAEWVWRIRLAENSDVKTFPGRLSDYYLGEDEKGIYLSPGPFSSAKRLSEKLSIKYRKVTE